MTSSVGTIETELSRLAAGTMRADEMLEVSRRLMAVAKGAPWSQAAAHCGKALYAQGRIADALRLFEDAWQRAEQGFDDPISGALAARLGVHAAPRCTTMPKRRSGTRANLSGPARAWWRACGFR